MLTHQYKTPMLYVQDHLRSWVKHKLWEDYKDKEKNYYKKTRGYKLHIILSKVIYPVAYSIPHHLSKMGKLSTSTFLNIHKQKKKYWRSHSIK